MVFKYVEVLNFNQSKVSLSVLIITQITFMEKDMDTATPAILCTRVDEHAGDWPSESFVGLFKIASKCVESKLTARPEIAEVRNTYLLYITCSVFLFFEIFDCS